MTYKKILFNEKEDYPHLLSGWRAVDRSRVIRVFRGGEACAWPLGIWFGFHTASLSSIERPQYRQTPRNGGVTGFEVVRS